MYKQEAREEYLQALKLGQREYKNAVAEGLNPYPEVLDEKLGTGSADIVQDIGLVDIPAEKIVGVKSAGRITAFTANFLPLLGTDSEFYFKWVRLCEAHLSTGIRDPILCYEYLGEFYVQEGNKRVSVLRYMGSPRISAIVKRIMPPRSEDPRIRAYYEFVDFYKSTGLYQVQFRKPGDYAALLTCLGKEPGQKWTDREKRTFSAYFQYFRNAFSGLNGKELGLTPEEALLVWLEIYPFQDLGKLSDKELRKTLTAIWGDLTALSLPEPVEVCTEPVDTEAEPGVLTRIITGTPQHLNVAFVHAMDPQSSVWIEEHDLARRYVQQILGSKVTVRSYYRANTSEEAQSLLDRAVEDGAEVVFTTTPQLSRATLRMAVKYPKVRFLNCSMDTPYSSIRTYYGRIYEAKFITGAIAGAMANDDKIGYIGFSPIFGEPASINAFALGAQMTNPRAKILLRWSCQAGDHQKEFLDHNIWVISNRDVPARDRTHLQFCHYGTYMRDDDGNMRPLASPVCLWEKLYVNVLRSILAGTWDKAQNTPKAVNYWWGMNSDVIDVELAPNLPDSTVALAKMLRFGLKTGILDPFRRRIVAQDGTVKNDGSRGFTPDELLRMDWLCENIEGKIPEFDEIEDYAKPMVRQLGIHRDRIPMDKEGSL